MSDDNDGTPMPDRASLRAQRQELETPFRVSAAIWVIYSAALVFTSMGSQLLAFAEVYRLVCLVLGVLSGVMMILRLVTPGHPEWSRWTLLLNGGTFLSTFVLSLFASEMTGGLTTSRIGYALLLLGCACTSYMHWFGEKLIWEEPRP